jgi:hypothetical protein
MDVILSALWTGQIDAPATFAIGQFPGMPALIAFEVSHHTLPGCFCELTIATVTYIDNFTGC